VLGDDDPTWRPDRYVDTKLGMRVEVQFPMVKLLDYRGREEELRSDPNPMALLVRAHLATLELRHDALRRKAAKLELFRDLLRRGYTTDEVRRLLSIVDWFLTLPAAMDDLFWEDVATELGEEAMEYITSFEQRGLRKGLQQGIEQGMQQGMQQGQGSVTLRLLTRKFGALPEDVTAQIRALDSEQMLDLAESLLDFTTFTDLTAWLVENPPASAPDADTRSAE
ncbi:MAG: DUF4351 domain-containing protein, partial [Chloroflexaceae bacterium]|nr:DUF4351 domain-containing protein [Chloroflexaceae bacterium]